MTGDVHSNDGALPDLLALNGALLEAAPDGTVVVDDDGRIVLVNTQTEAIFGYERADLVGGLVESQP